MRIGYCKSLNNSEIRVNRGGFSQRPLIGSDCRLQLWWFSYTAFSITQSVMQVTPVL